MDLPSHSLEKVMAAQRAILQGALTFLAVCAFFIQMAVGQTVLTTLEPNELAGQRPYEMVWANRKEPSAPSLRFDRLDGWKVEAENGAEALLQLSRAQNVWDRPVAKLKYRGGTNSGRIRISFAQPVPVHNHTDVQAWIFGNRWDWENPPDTPPLQVHLQFDHPNHRSVAFTKIRWKEWWLAHLKLPKFDRETRLVGLEFSGGGQKEWREIFLDSISFYSEKLAPLQIPARPARNLTLFQGQSPGANTGPGKLNFPTREETILPLHKAGPYTTDTEAAPDGAFRFLYHGSDGQLTYTLHPGSGMAIRAEWNGKLAGVYLDGAKTSASLTNAALKNPRLENQLFLAELADETQIRIQLQQKSLLLDFINPATDPKELNLGQIRELTRPRTIYVPFMTYGSSHPAILISETAEGVPLFSSILLDWYRSNGSEPFGANTAGAATARINGGVRYHRRTDGQANPMFERFFLTVSPLVEEVLPVVPNPVGRNAARAVDRLWQESWGPQNFQTEQKRSAKLRAYGIEKLIQCNHEIAWRDGGESFTLRLRAAPDKGGDKALKQYVAHQKSLGWFAGLYSNYTDYAPVNEFWDPDKVQRQPDGNWRPAWPRCYALKPLAAVEFDRVLAPQIKALYQSTSAYTDVHTAVAPWAYNDYDARLPGAGTFAQTFYAYGELLQNDSRVYDNPIFSEGSFHWLYAGLADGNYAIAYDGHPLAKEHLFPLFDLLQIHPKECDIGMGWTSHFCDPIPKWNAPENLDRSIDRFLLHTLAYGHIGWLVEEAHGITRTCRSYYMLQQVQAQYGLQAPAEVGYWDGTNLLNPSQALVRELPRTRRQLFVRYPSGLKLWLNDHPQESWKVELAGQTIVLPPAGWAAENPSKNLFSFSGREPRSDYIRCPDYLYLDGRGKTFDVPEAVSDGALALSSAGENKLQLLWISGTNSVVIRRPFGLKGTASRIECWNETGQPLNAPKFAGDASQTSIEPVPGALKYVVRFLPQSAP